MSVTTFLVLSHIAYSSTALLIGIPWTSAQAGLVETLHDLIFLPVLYIYVNLEIIYHKKENIFEICNFD
jgi:hypothetical protein